jgi:hypothetical protein
VSPSAITKSSPTPTEVTFFPSRFFILAGVCLETKSPCPS